MLAQYIAKHKVPFDTYMMERIEKEPIPKTLKESMLYSLSVGGKRLRPILLFAVLDTLGLNPTQGYQIASALEMIHTYSLIHDDLPAMDDDDLRRGKPTNHKVFGEATAILAGDSLLTHAFLVVSGDETLSFEQRIRLITMLSTAAGPMGMVAGQMLDMEAETSPITIEQLKEIHLNKTGRLIEFAIVAAAIIANATDETVQLLRCFANHVGLAFQIKDDILDVEGNSTLIGKQVGSDIENGKSTYVSLTSLTDAKKMLDEEIHLALQVLEKLPYDTTLLAAITDYIKERQV